MVKCNIENCETKATYGLKQEFATRCKKHAEKDMVHNSRTYCSHGKSHSKCKDCKNDLVCSVDDCKEKSVYGIKQGFTTKCKTHREDCMVKQPRGYCEHDKDRKHCKPCKGSSLCKHGKQRAYCKDCEGSQFCEHGILHATCKDCEGSQICEHRKQREFCKDCEGSQICEHRKQRAYCKDCEGSQICKHGKQRAYCKDCEGSQICKHGKQRSQCYRCTPTSNYFCKRKYNDDKRCISAKTQKDKYDGYCASCFVEKCPDDPRTAFVHLPIKEIAVRKEIESAFPNIFIFNEGIIISNGENIYYPDMRAHFKMCVFIIEIDEGQHKGYDMKKEKIRIMKIYEAVEKNIVLLRFNPDEYIEDEEIKNSNMTKRYEVLNNKIKEVIDKIKGGYVFSEWLTEYKLFFDDGSKLENDTSICCSGFSITAKRRCLMKVTKEGEFCYRHKSQSTS